MLIAKPTTLFGKDVQRMAARGRDIVKIISPLMLLANGTSLPSQYGDHPLKGQWTGRREFHVESDWLVIYRLEGGFLVLERTGTHADLFKK